MNLNILIIYNKDKDPDQTKINILKSFLDNLNVNYIIKSIYKNIETDYKHDFNLILTLGGDGTMMHGCKYALEYESPILGINIGHLGFLTQLDINQLYTLKPLFSGKHLNITPDKFYIEKRAVLETIIDNQKYFAINDIVLARSGVISLSDFDLYSNNLKMLSYRADGLILSTPTGSTAYSLAAGGPIVDPLMRAIILTPIASHSLKSRPIIFGENRSVKVIVKSDFKINISIDGKIVKQANKNNYIEVKISNKVCNFIKLINHESFKIFQL